MELPEDLTSVKAAAVLRVRTVCRLSSSVQKLSLQFKQSPFSRHSHISSPRPQPDSASPPGDQFSSLHVIFHSILISVGKSNNGIESVPI